MSKTNVVAVKVSMYKLGSNMINPFSLFDLPIAFEVDQAQLSQRYLTLQKSLHPDNFAQHSAQEQRLAMQKSAEINDALLLLKDPIRRADCIIALHTGCEQNPEQKSNQDMAFLMQQMQWREQLEELEQQKDMDQLMDFAQQIEQEQQVILTQISTALAGQQWQLAQQFTDRLRFVKKLSVEIERIEEILVEF